MLKPIKVTTRAAMEVARLDRNKFNQAVADGFYACAPTTMLGAQRVFGLSDLVGLYVFARETEAGVSARVAGLLACRVAHEVTSYPEEDRICFGKGVNGVEWALPISRANIDASRIMDTKVEQIRIFHVGNIKEQLLARLDEVSFPSAGVED